MKGSGKINLTIQERFVEIDAKTAADRKLGTGESVRITATDPAGLVIVEPLVKE
jgi:predicted molibdopterin-dependent oxidoreductase YjgC